MSVSPATATQAGAEGADVAWSTGADVRRVAARPAVISLAVTCCVVAHLGMSVLWATMMPPFEAHDETGHFAHVQYVATTLRIPPPGGVLTSWFDEAHQPPLYYWVAGLAGRALNLGGDYKPPMNPFFLRGDGEGGVNAVVHDPAAETWTGSRWATLLLIARAVSSLFGSLAVLGTYLVARELTPNRPWLAVLASAIAAGTPTFVFISGAANNDAAVAATGAFATLAGLAWYRHGVSAGADGAGTAGPARGALPRAALAGAAVGAALLTKNSALPLVAVFPLVGAGRWLRARGPIAAPLFEAVAGAAVCAVVAAWWYVRNLVLYGHVVMDRTAADSITLQPLPPSGALSQAASSHFATALLGYSFTSYWTLFAWGNIAPPDGVAAGFAAFCLVSIAGLVALLASGRLRRRIGVHDGVAWMATLLFAVLTALPLYRAIRYAAPTLMPGRYLFVSLAVCSALLAIGWWVVSAWLPRGLAVAARAAAGMAPSCVAAVALFATVLPRYAPPALIHEEDVAREAAPLHVVYGQRFELVGYRINGPAAVAPGRDLSVTLYWKCLRPMDTSYTFTVQLVDDSRTMLGRTDRLPGHGNFPTTLWRPGDEFGETFLVQMDPLAPAGPQLGHLVVNVVDFAASSQGANDFKERGALAAADAQGHPLAQVAFADLRLGAPPAIEPPQRSIFRLDDQLGLLGVTFPARARAGSPLPIQLRFQRSAPGTRAATLFVHVLDSQGKVVAQVDEQPRVDGRPYPTSLWRVGEVVPVSTILALPTGLASGTYQVELGLYWPDSQKRLHIVDASGHAAQDDRVLAGPLVIVP